MMRCGELIIWKQQYGFIRESGTDEQFFVHINEVTDNAGVLHKGQHGSFEIGVITPNRSRRRLCA